MSRVCDVQLETRFVSLYNGIPLSVCIYLFPFHLAVIYTRTRCATLKRLLFFKRKIKIIKVIAFVGCTFVLTLRKIVDYNISALRKCSLSRSTFDMFTEVKERKICRVLLLTKTNVKAMRKKVGARIAIY